MLFSKCVLRKKSAPSVSRLPQAAKKPATPKPARNVAHAEAPRVLFVTPEMGGYIKAGGLGDVAASLPRAMLSVSDVRVLIPGYPAVLQAHPDLEIVNAMPAVAGLPAWRLLRGSAPDGLTLYVVECPELYARDGTPYGACSGVDYADNDIRFARLSLAAAEIAAGEADPAWRPTILHANDWPTAMALAYARWKNVEARSIFTIHNLAYQGLFDASSMADLAIPANAFDVDGLEFHGKISFLKAGIFYASHVTTVSANYAREITSENLGCGLHGLLETRAREGRLTGILNGIDDSWQGPDGCTPLQKWKQLHAAEIRRRFQLSAGSGPLFSVISRLVHHKGIDLSIQVAEQIVRAGGQLVVTGQGEERFENAVKRLAERYKGAIAARIGFNEVEAREIFAASDFLLMPSRFEPCGLSQMYAQKSGALPIAFRTGGLADTVEDGRSGFLFSRFTGQDLHRAVDKAMWLFRSHHPVIRRMRRYALSRRYSWADSTRRYLSVYTAS